MTTKLPPPFDKLHTLKAGPPAWKTSWETRALPADPITPVPAAPGSPDDRRPLADDMQQLPHVLYAVTVLQAFFRGRPGVFVSANTPVYYIDSTGAQRIVYPDCYVATGVDPIAVRRRNGYFIREAGRPPAFAMEMASATTHPNDTGFKRELYARLGVTEYWRFDGAEEQLYPERLAGDQLAGGEYTPIETTTGPDGVIRGHSTILGLDICWDNLKLRFYDPAAGGFLLSLDESADLLDEELAARRVAEEQVSRELAARQAAEERIRQLEEQLWRRPPE